MWAGLFLALVQAEIMKKCPGQTVLINGPIGKEKASGLGRQGHLVKPKLTGEQTQWGRERAPCGRNTGSVAALPTAGLNMAPDTNSLNDTGHHDPDIQPEESPLTPSYATGETGLDHGVHSYNTRNGRRQTLNCAARTVRGASAVNSKQIQMKEKQAPAAAMTQPSNTAEKRRCESPSRAAAF